MHMHLPGNMMPPVKLHTPSQIAQSNHKHPTTVHDHYLIITSIFLTPTPLNNLPKCNDFRLEKATSQKLDPEVMKTY